MRINRTYLTIILFLTVMSGGYYLIDTGYIDAVLLHNIKLVDIGYVCMAGYGIFNYLILKKVPINRTLLKWLAFFTAYIFFEMWYTQRLFPMQSFRDTCAYAVNYLYFLLLIPFYDFLKDEERRRKAIKVIYIFTVSALVLYFISYIGKIKIFYSVTSMYGEHIRDLAGMPCFSTLIIIHSYINILHGVRSKLSGFIFSLAGMALLTTLIRGTIVVIGISLLIVLILNKSRVEKRLFWFYTATLFLIVSLYLSFGAVLMERMQLFSSKTTEATGEFRKSIVTERWELIFEENPLFGVGFLHPNTGIDFGLIYGSNWHGVRLIPTPDIAAGSIIGQLGLVGVGFYVLLFLIYFKITQVSIKNLETRKEHSATVALFMAVQIFMFIQPIYNMNCNYIGVRPWELTFVMALGMVLSEYLRKELC